MWSGTGSWARSWTPTSGSTPARPEASTAPHAEGGSAVTDWRANLVSIDIANESGVGVDEFALATIARYVLDELGIHPLAELSVLLVDEKAMAKLHKDWMNEPGPTDVLAFPKDELELLAVHGILHLLGYDHADPEERADMFGLQDRLLASWRSGRVEQAG